MSAPISTPTLGISQGTPQVLASANIVIFANIQHVPDPTEESYKEFTKCLKLILPLVQLFPTKTLERELLCSVDKQLPFFIFPPTRIRRKHQKLLINRTKKFQEGKWEELWKQSIREYDIEREHREHIQPPKQKSIPEKDRRSQFFHKFRSISKASKVLTSEMKHTDDSQDVVRIQSLFPLPSENYENPIQLYHNPSHHWSSDDEILEIWNTPVMEERDGKYHSIVVLFKYIRSRPLLCAPDVDGWRMKEQFQHIFLSSDPDNDELKDLIHDCFYIRGLLEPFCPISHRNWLDVT
jgi:hypothetical protein